MIVCIAGMHRSGTSMVARMLNVCGMSLGAESDMMSPNAYNSEGYWENTKFVEINDQILSILGGAWDMPPKTEPGWEHSPRLAALQDEARNLIKEFAGFPTWGWKDPRNSLTLPFWQSLIPDLKVVLCLRNPLEVAHSLERRGASSYLFSFNLWQIYNQSILDTVPTQNQLVTHYQTYFIDARLELRRLLDFIGLSATEAQMESACATGLDSLRHSQDSFEDAAQVGAPEETLTLYADLTSQSGPVYWGAFIKDLQHSTASVDKGLESRQGLEKQWLVRLVEKDQELQVLRPLVEENARLSSYNNSLTRRVNELVAHNEEQSRHIANLTSHNEYLVQEVNSLGYRVFRKIRSIMARLVPAGSTRYRLYGAFLRAFSSVFLSGPKGTGKSGGMLNGKQQTGSAKGGSVLSFASHKILFVASSAEAGEPQHVLLGLLRWLKKYTALQISILLFSGGALLKQFKSIGPVLILEDPEKDGSAQLNDFCGSDLKLVYFIGSVSGRRLRLLQPHNAPILFHFQDSTSGAGAVPVESPELVSRFIVESLSARDCLIQSGSIEASRVDLINLLMDEEPGVSPDKRQQAAIDNMAPQILSIMRKTAGIKPAVSVIVPCFNHSAFLPKRLDSILNQTFRDYELILLDDASSDATPNLLSKYKERPGVQVEINQVNSGSTFPQWIKGIQKSSADILWIAEDDDYCEYALLENLLPYFNDPAVKLAYSQSRAVDDQGQPKFSYLNHTREFSETRWKSSYVVPANEEVNAGLAITNTIPNASAVLFRRFDIKEWSALSETMKLAGDWLFYLFAMRDGKIGFCPDHLNYHRRHANTNIYRTQFSRQRFEEVVKTQSFIARHFDLSEQTLRHMKEYTRRVWDSVNPGQPEKFESQYEEIFETPL